MKKRSAKGLGKDDGQKAYSKKDLLELKVGSCL